MIRNGFLNLALMEKTSRHLNGISKHKWTSQTISERFELDTSYNTIYYFYAIYNVV